MVEVDNNIAVVLYHYLRVLSVKVSRSTVHRLLDTPLGDGIRGISDALDMLLVKNEVYQLPSSDYFCNWNLLSSLCLRWTEIHFV